MYTGLKHLHSFWPYILLSLTLIASGVFLISWLSKRPFTKGNKKLALFTLIAAHLQFVFGLILYFISPVVKAARSNPEMMKNAHDRLYAVEHISIMIIAVILITIGYSKAKRMRNPIHKHRTLALLFLLALVLMFSRIPWSVWPNINI